MRAKALAKRDAHVPQKVQSLLRTHLSSVRRMHWELLNGNTTLLWAAWCDLNLCAESVQAEEERDEGRDGSGSEGTNMRRNRKHKMRERQQEALASGKIKPARIRASKLVSFQVFSIAQSNRV